MSGKIKIQVVKTPTSVYISDKLNQENYYGSKLSCFLIDEKEPIQSFHKDWYQVKKIPEKMERLISQDSINRRYELKDSSLQSEKIPLVLLEDRIEEYQHLISLYCYKSDPVPDKKELVEFEIDKILELNFDENPSGFSYPVQKKEKSEDYHLLTDLNVNYDLLSQIVTPSIALPSGPCYLSSRQSYKIIRSHVQLNIDPKYAVITSDYDFCFTVQKRIPVVEPIPYQINIGTTKKEKLVTRFRNDRKITIFEMTSQEDHYQGYTPIPPFRGNCLKNLEENINIYLENLIKLINTPYIECSYCKGLGVILENEKENK